MAVASVSKGQSPGRGPFGLICALLSVVGYDERRLAAAMVERLLETVKRHTEPDERRERVRPAPSCLVERVDGGDPVAALRVDAAEDDAILEDRVEREHAAL